jgi:basic membrane protein A
VIAVGFLMESAIGQVAKQFPKTHFAIIDDSVKSAGIKGAKNVEGLLFKEQESGYLAGYLAGLMEQRSGPRLNKANVVSTVGGIKLPAVDHYIAGFQAGAKKADPTIKTLNGYSNSFTAQDKCKSLAEAQIAQGSDIVFQVAGGCGLGALSAANSHHYWGIGVDADQGYLGPYILVSAIKRVDQAVYLTTQAEEKGTFHGGTDVTFSLKDGGTGIAGISKLVPPALVSKVDSIASQIKSGKIVPPNVVKSS